MLLMGTALSSYLLYYESADLSHGHALVFEGLILVAWSFIIKKLNEMRFLGMLHE